MTGPVCWHTARTKVRESRRDLALVAAGQPSTLGEVRYTRSTPRRELAEIEAADWNRAGYWHAEVVEGRSPTDPSIQAKP